MSPAPLSTRLGAAIFGLAGAIGDRRHLLPSWAVVCAQGMLVRLQRRITGLLRRIESGVWRPRAPRPTRPQTFRPASAPAPRPSVPALARFPRIRGLLSEMLMYSGGITGNTGAAGTTSLGDLLDDPALHAHARAVPALARELRRLCHGLGRPIPDAYAPPPRPPRTRASPPQTRPPQPRPRPAPGEPTWRKLWIACRAERIARIWRCTSAPPDCLLAGVRPLLSKPVLRILAREFKFLDKIAAA